MYFSETFPQVCHVEESTRLEKLEQARRAQETKAQPQQKAVEPAKPAKDAASTPTTAPPAPARSLTQAFLQRPPLSRPGSSGVLGNIFQGFSREVQSHSQAASAASTPTREKPIYWGRDPDADPNLIRGFVL